MAVSRFRLRVVPTLLGLVLMAGIFLLIWQLVVVPAVAERIRAQTGLAVKIGSLWPSGGGVLLRRVVVYGAPPFERMPLGRIDRLWVGFGGKTFSWYQPSKVVVRKARLTFLRAGGVDNLRGRRAKKPEARKTLGRPRLEIDIADARLEAFYHLAPGHALAVRSEAFSLHRGSDGGLAARMTALVADLPNVASLKVPSLTVTAKAGTDERTAHAAGVTLRVAEGGALLENLTLLARISDQTARLSVRPARPGADHPGSTSTGFRFSAELEGERVSVVVGAARLPLAPMRRLAERAGLDLGAATAQFDLELESTPAGVGNLVYQVELQDVGLSHPKLDAEPWPGVDFSAVGRARLDLPQRRLELTETELSAFGLPLSLRGFTALRPRPTGSWTLSTPPGRAPTCQALLAAQPAPIRDNLAGLALAGRFGIAAQLSFDAARYEDLDLGVRLSPRCQVTREPEALLELREQLAPPRVVAPAAGRHPWPLDPGHPDFVALERLPKHLVAAFVTAEDGTFFEHEGVDLEMVRRALAYDLERGSLARGASTITQQVAKNLFLSPERTLGRKLLEVVYAWRLEETLSKNRILELYLNLVQLGPGIRGVKAGAEAYFGKPVGELSTLEAAHLAALTPNPMGYARRFREGRVDEGWLHRLYDLLGMMKRSGRLSPADLAAARQSRLVIRKI